MSRITVGRTIVFAVELTVSTTDYVIDGFLFLDQRIEGEYLFRNTLTIRATQSGSNWSLRYNLSDDSWSEARGKAWCCRRYSRRAPPHTAKSTSLTEPPMRRAMLLTGRRGRSQSTIARRESNSVLNRVRGAVHGSGGTSCLPRQASQPMPANNAETWGIAR